MTVCSSTQRKKRRDPSKIKFKAVGNHDEFISRITKTLYYGKLPLTERFSLPVTELAAELYSEVKNGRSLERLRVDETAEISRHACVSPCSLVLALLYLERLKSCNAEYVEKVAPSELFLVSMMVASKFLHDDGEEDEVFNDEWALSGGIDLKQMNRLEREFLNAIDWEVYISNEKFWARLQQMEKELALRQGRRRGWFSYTEISQLMKTVELVSLAQTILTMSAVCLTSYAASVLAMVGSTLLVNQIPTASELVLYTSNFVPPCIPVSTSQKSNHFYAIDSDTIPGQIFSSIQDCPLANETSALFCRNEPKFWQNLPREMENIHNKNASEIEIFTKYAIASFGIVNDNQKENKNWLSISNLIKYASKTNSPTIMIPVEIATH